MKKSDLIHDELQIYQDILNYQMTGLAAPELQYTKQQIQQLNKKCDKLYVDYLVQIEKEKKRLVIKKISFLVLPPTILLTLLKKGNKHFPYFFTDL